MMNLWEKRFDSRREDPALEAFNASIAQDGFLYEAEIQASQAYAEALHGASVLSEKESTDIRAGLERVRRRIASGEDLSRFEDIHSAVELLLVEEVGEAGEKLHTGRSRNEQVTTDERLYLKQRMPLLIDGLIAVQETVLSLAESHPDVLMPGYTHLQRGQCVLFAHYILSLFWALERGKDRIRDAWKRVDVLPLGSGALAGSTVALDRERMRERLGFLSSMPNSIDAVTDRSFILEVLFALSLIQVDLSRYCEDLILFVSPEFGFLEMDDSIATSSSLMPQKKNPDYFELIRGSAGRFFGYAAGLFVTLKGLPTAYNKDMQQDKEPLRRGVEGMLEVLDVFNTALGRIAPNREKMRRSIDASLFATDLVDHLVARGVAFRRAHGIVGEITAHAEKEGKSLDALPLETYRRFHDGFDRSLYDVFEPARSVAMKRTAGSTHPDEVVKQLEQAKKRIQGRKQRSPGSAGSRSG